MKYSIGLNVILLVIVAILGFNTCGTQSLPSIPMVDTSQGLQVTHMTQKIAQGDSTIASLLKVIRKKDKRIGELVSITRTHVSTSGTLVMPLTPKVDATTGNSTGNTTEDTPKEDGLLVETDTQVDSGIINTILGSISKEYGFTHEGKNLSLNGVSNILTGETTVNYSYRLGLTNVLTTKKKIFGDTYSLEVFADDPQVNLTGQHTQILPPWGVDISLQMGMGLTGKAIMPYVGLGVSKSIWRIDFGKEKKKNKKTRKKLEKL